MLTEDAGCQIPGRDSPMSFIRSGDILAQSPVRATGESHHRSKDLQ
jgi:hypothetical protein